MKIEINDDLIKDIIESIEDLNMEPKPEGKVLEEMIIEYVNVALKEALDSTWAWSFLKVPLYW